MALSHDELADALVKRIHVYIYELGYPKASIERTHRRDGLTDLRVTSDISFLFEDDQQQSCMSKHIVSVNATDDPYKVSEKAYAVALKHHKAVMHKIAKLIKLEKENQSTDVPTAI